MAIGFARARFTFLAKVAWAAALVGFGDLFFYGVRSGSTLGAFALLWTATLALTRPDVRSRTGSRAALLAATAFGFVLVYDPGLLGWVLFWAAIASASLLPRAGFTDALSWGGRLLVHGVTGVATPFRDLGRFGRAGRSRGRVRVGAVVALLALPVVGGAGFLALFAGANPLIGRALAAIELPDLSALVPHLLLWALLLVCIWPNLRPRNTVWRGEGWADVEPLVVTLRVPVLVLSLVTFNAVFAVENGLDLAYLWSGAALPEGVSVADYARQGAHLLIATALLAGLFVLVALAPGSEGARSPAVRRLVVLWVGQNLLLVASSVLRTLNYVAGSELTVLRIQALAWMGLVAVGLLLICWRMLCDRSARWLINRNALAAGIVLATASVADLGATAATFNARHARTTQELDLCYFSQLGVSATIPLIALERRAIGPKLRDQLAWLRLLAMDRLTTDQSDWHSWTLAGARRLAEAKRLLGNQPIIPLSMPRDCDGKPVVPSLPEQPVTAPVQTGAPTPPLTGAPRP